MELNDGTIIAVNLGTLGVLLGYYSRLIYRLARLELNQEFLSKQLDSAHQKIRDLERVSK